MFLECEKIYAKVFGNDHEKAKGARKRSAMVGKQDGEVDHETPVAAHKGAAAVGTRKPSEDKDGEDVDDDTGLLHGMASLRMQDPQALREASQGALAEPQNHQGSQKSPSKNQQSSRTLSRT